MKESNSDEVTNLGMIKEKKKIKKYVEEGIRIYEASNGIKMTPEQREFFLKGFRCGAIFMIVEDIKDDWDGEV